VSIIEALKMALAAVWANRLRSVLTLLGVIIGVTSVITIISAIEAMSQAFEDQVSALGPSTFIVTKFGIITSEEEYFTALKRKDLTMDDMRAVQKGCPDCQEVSARSYTRSDVKRGNKGLRRVIIGGSTANFLDVIDIQLDEGRSFTEAEYNRNNRVAFIGPTIGEELFPGVDPIGKTLKIRGRKFTVIGISKRRGSFLGNNRDNFIMIPLTAYIKVFGKPGRNLDLLIKSTTVEGIFDTQDQVRSILRARRGVDYNDDDDFAILTADNILAFVDNITRVARIALVAISSIALVVGGIVIMNIMMVSVTERTREIGIRKSIGARRKNVLVQFLFEALILSLGGGLIGTATGIGLAIILGGQISLSVQPSIFAIAAGLSISTGVGVFFGIYPAMKAAKMDPIDALRFEN
jgi:putative ABC transport system permease protein